MNMPWQDPRVQRGMEALFNLRDERLAAGDKCIGWKIAFGSKPVQEKLGISAPLVGFLFQSRVLRSGETASLAGWAKPIIEPEIAVHLGRDLAAGEGREKAAAAIEKLGPSFEFIDSPKPPENPEPVLAGNIAHRHVVLGPIGKLVPEQMRAKLFRGPTEAASTDDVQALPGDPRSLLAYVADYLGAFGEKLKAGDIVICGSVVPPVAVEAQDESFRFVLEPIGEVSVRFSR